MKLHTKVLKNIVSKAVRAEVDGWPPVCIGVIYQPLRPSREKNTAQKVKASK